MGVIANLSNPSLGIYRYILKPGRQIITITSSGFLSLRYETENLNIIQVVHLRITPKEVVPTKMVEKGSSKL